MCLIISSVEPHPAESLTRHAHIKIYILHEVFTTVSGKCFSVIIITKLAPKAQSDLR